MQRSKTHITVRLFATLKDLAGVNHLDLPLDQAITIDQLRHDLAERHPALAAALPTAIAAVNSEYVFAGHPIQAGDEVAFFPPVSGGVGFPEYFAITNDPIDLNDLTQRLVTPEVGAIALFSGYVRGQTSKNGGTQETSYLEYEAYEPMAVAKMPSASSE